MSYDLMDGEEVFWNRYDEIRIPRKLLENMGDSLIPEEDSSRILGEYLRGEVLEDIDMASFEKCCVYYDDSNKEKKGKEFVDYCKFKRQLIRTSLTMMISEFVGLVPRAKYEKLEYDGVFY